MAISATTLRDRLVATIEAITATAIPDYGAVKFRLLDKNDEPGSPYGNSGLLRRFSIWFDEGAESAAVETGYHHPTEYEAIQRFRLIVLYPMQSDWKALDALIREDVHDIKKSIDSGANWGSDVNLQIVSSWSRPSAPEDESSVWRQGISIDVRFQESSV